MELRHRCNSAREGRSAIKRERFAFVCACRKGQPLNKEYDIIIGNVADDDGFKSVDMYFRGLWDQEKVLGELRYYKMNNQICIVNQETLNRLITFKRAYEVKDHGR